MYPKQLAEIIDLGCKAYESKHCVVEVRDDVIDALDERNVDFLDKVTEALLNIQEESK